MSSPVDETTHVLRFVSEFKPGKVLRGSSFSLKGHCVTFECDALEATVSEVCAHFRAFLIAAGWPVSEGQIVYDKDAVA